MNIAFRRLTHVDLEFLNEVRNECCGEYLHNSCKYAVEETYEWFYKTKPLFWIILLEGERIGYFRTSNWVKENKNIYLGADLHKNFRGKGLGYESYCKFIPLLFNEMDLHKISLEVLATNERAINLYKKLGFKIEGVKRDEIIKNGKWVNSIIMSILENEWNEGM